MNKAHRIMRDITKRVVCSDLELNDFGLSLGFTCEEITQKMTNHSKSVETAAWSLACEWWDASHESDADKSEILVQAVETTGKAEMVDRVREMLFKNADEKEFHNARETSLVTESGQVRLGTESINEGPINHERNGKIAQSSANTQLSKPAKTVHGQSKKIMGFLRSKPKCNVFPSKKPPTAVVLKSEDEGSEKVTNGNVQKRKMNKYIPTELLY